MLKIFVITALIAAFVLFSALVGMIAFSSQQTEGDDNAQPSVTERGNSHDGNSAVDKTASDRSKETKKKRDWYYTFIERPTDWLLVLFNGFLVLATIALFVSGERNVEAANRAARAAGDSATAAQTAVELSDKTAERQLRAYIGVNSMDVKVYPFEKGEFAFIAHIEMRNFGQTPANNMSVWAEAVIDGPDAKPFDMTKEPARPTGGAIAFPTAAFNVDKGWAISTADKEALYKREKFLFLWGTVRYTDVFGKDRYFRYRMQSTGQIVIGTTGTYAVAPLTYESD